MRLIKEAATHGKIPRPGEKSQVKCLVEGNILLPAMYNLNHFPRKSLREFSLRVQ